jgi:serine/threonine-protein kinase
MTQFVAGEVVGERYRLIQKLGEGGMGVVWVAHSMALGVDVAIKLMRTGATDADLSSRMAREAQVTATLGHPSLVRVFDFGTTEHGDPFLVMELARGETLAALLRREKKLPPVQAVQLLLPLLDGLRCAHERGIVHRDIKPENVLIARDELGRVQPKLLDFGIAKLESAPNVSRLTQVGEVLGSPEFMSPEQARGSGDIDARTDIWSACVVLYEMLTGVLPFKLQNYNALMQAILHDEPIATLAFGVGDRELSHIVQKGLEKSRDKRWANMTELGEALAFWLYDQGIHEDVAGNSLKAQWLGGGTLTGLAAETKGDVIVPAELAARGLPTMRLKVRSLRRRVQRAFTPARLAALGALILLGLVALSWRYVSHPAVVPSSVLAPPPLSTVPAAAPITASNLPEPVASTLSAPAPSDRAPSRRPKKSSPERRSSGSAQASSKSIRDFGF